MLHDDACRRPLDSLSRRSGVEARSLGLNGGGAALNPLRDLRDKCPERYDELFCELEERALHFDLEQELSEIRSLTGESEAPARD